MPELLEVRGVVAGYGRGPAILNGATLTVRPGQVQCIIGPNGAGKSTLLKAIAGLLPVREGEIRFKGERIDGLRPDQILRKGICFVPQERALFPKMTVRENLRMGGYVLRDKRELEERIEEVLEQFPILRERALQHAGTLSGGQQQMLAMARTLIVEPEIVMLDEPSLGLGAADRDADVRDHAHAVGARHDGRAGRAERHRGPEARRTGAPCSTSAARSSKAPRRRSSRTRASRSSISAASRGGVRNVSPDVSNACGTAQPPSW